MTDSMPNTHSGDNLAFDAQSHQRPQRKRVKVPEGQRELTAHRGLKLARRWTTAGVDPFDQVAWETRAAVISGEKGQVVFEQQGIEVPAAWSQLATNVVVSKYFRGNPGTPERETSVRQLIGRVVDPLGRPVDGKGPVRTITPSPTRM